MVMKERMTDWLSKVSLFFFTITKGNYKENQLFVCKTDISKWIIQIENPPLTSFCEV